MDLNISGIADDLISIENEESVKDNSNNNNREIKPLKENFNIENNKINHLYDRQLDSYQQYLKINKQLSQSINFKKKENNNNEAEEFNNNKRKKNEKEKERENLENYYSRKIRSEINSFYESEKEKELYKYLL